MPRKKAAPSRVLGLPETRPGADVVLSPLSLDEAPDETGPARTFRRRRAPPKPSLPPLVTVGCATEQQAVYPVAELLLQMHGADRLTGSAAAASLDGDKYGVRVSFERVPGADQAVVAVLLDDVAGQDDCILLGALPLPFDLACSLARLLNNQRLLILLSQPSSLHHQPIRNSAGAGAGASGRSERGAAQQGGGARLLVAVTDKALEGEELDPNEWVNKKQVHADMLAVLLWLLPGLHPDALPATPSPGSGTTGAAPTAADLHFASEAAGTTRLLTLEQQRDRAACAALAAASGASPTQPPLGGGSTPTPGSPRSPRGAGDSPPAIPDTPLSPISAAAAAAGGDASFDAAELYAAIRPSRQAAEYVGELAGLQPQLRRYQRQALQWMLSREGKVADGGSAAQGPQLHPLWRPLHPLQPGGAALYVNVYNGLLTRSAPAAPPPVLGGILADEMGLGKTVEAMSLILANPCGAPDAPAATGGDAGSGAVEQPAKRRKVSNGGRGGGQGEECSCVCGEVEPPGSSTLWLQCDCCDQWVHAACFGIRRPPAGEWVCPACKREAALQRVSGQSRATLIICPSSIRDQWRSEIEKHVQPGALKVLVYEGQPQGVQDSARVVSAAELAAADVVLTSYEVLRREVHKVADAGEAGARAKRRAKRYEVIPTALPHVNFWRICLDEAQEVESGATGAARLALQLRCKHRWVVTGTPISRSVQDLYGLIAFLRAAPYNDKRWWMCALQRPYERGSGAARTRLLRLLCPVYGGLMWRNSKADVAGELQLPPQGHMLTLLRFHAVERHWYQRQHQECLSVAQKAFADLPGGFRAPAASDAAGWETLDRPLGPAEQRKVLQPLLKLRQACCHPQVGSSGIRSLEASAAPMSMDEVLEVMIGKARGEAEEAQRQVIAATNGLAGLHAIDGRLADAVAAYRSVLQLVESNRKLVRMDPLQRLHTLSNLGQLLGPHGRGVPGVLPTLRDATLQADADKIRDEYVLKFTARLGAASADYRGGVDAVSATLTDEGRLRPQDVTTWYCEAADLLARYGQGDAAAQAISRSLYEDESYLRLTERNAFSMRDRITSVLGLKLLLDKHFREAGKAREASLEALEALQAGCEAGDAALVLQAGNCGRCRVEKGSSSLVCRHCKLDEAFLRWELQLFSIAAKAMTQGKKVSVEDALRSAQQATLRRVGRGGLNEVQALAQELEADADEPEGSDGRGGAAVSRTDIVRKASEAERVCERLMGQLRQLKGLSAADAASREAVVALARRHLDALAAERRLFIKARAAALAQRLVLYARDELEMAVLRFQLVPDDEPVAPLEEGYKLKGAQLVVKNDDLTRDKAVWEAELGSKLGTLRYLLGLEAARKQAALTAAPAQPKAAHGEDDEVTEGEVCPVCQEVLGSDLAMLSCGHTLCTRCCMMLIEQLPKQASPVARRIRCPNCRKLIAAWDVAYVNTGTGGTATTTTATAPTPGGQARAAGPSTSGGEYYGCEEEGALRQLEERIVVKGQYGTKLEAVVRRILAVTQQDSTSRLLVFSSWRDVLSLIAHALSTNDVPFVLPTKKFQQQIQEFKQGVAADRAADVDGAKHTPRVLLMLVKQGGKGLNLTEAQHVVLAEPQLDPAAEAQAVGRVHRIGQARPTWVHRFVVEGSVEEGVYRLGRQRAAAMDMAAAAVGRRGAADDKSLTVRDIALLLMPQHDAD